MSDAKASAPVAADEAKPDAVKAEAEPATTEITDKTPEAASPDQKPVEAKLIELTTADHVDHVAEDAPKDAPKAVEAQPSDEAPKPNTIATETKPEDVKAPTLVAEPAKTAEKADDKAGAKPGDVPTAATATPAVATDANKGQDRLPDPDKPAAPPKPALAMAKGTGPISVFISRKDAKLYVRQNFAPLFDVPVTIAPSDRPLGTHIFTAEADKTDSNILHWTVVTLPASHKAERRDDDERGARHRKVAGAVEIAKPVPEPDNPTEALDRITIPADAMARITEALSTSGSIIVSDQGIAAGETGEGTDFIVSLR
jgi:hypothetical protein